MSERTNDQLKNPKLMSERASNPNASLGFTDAIALIFGIVLGAGIFKTPILVPANAGNANVMMWAWFVGGIMFFIGALCDAELAIAHPDAGGNYYYLMWAFGKLIAFLFFISRMTVIQTGSIARLAFVLRDDTSQRLRLGNHSALIDGAGAIVLVLAKLVPGLSACSWRFPPWARLTPQFLPALVPTWC